MSFTCIFKSNLIYLKTKKKLIRKFLNFNSKFKKTFRYIQVQLKAKAGLSICK